MKSRIFTRAFMAFSALFLLMYASSSAQWLSGGGSVGFYSVAGLGTNTPYDRLHIHQQGSTTSATLRLSSTWGGCTATGQLTMAYVANTFSNAATSRDLVLRTVVQPQDAHAGNCGEDIVVSTQTSNGAIRFATWDGTTAPHYDAERMTIIQNGNVGIGTTTPIHRLTLRGGDLSFDEHDAGHRRAKIRLFQDAGVGSDIGHAIGTQAFYTTFGPTSGWGEERPAIGHMFYNRNDQLVARIGSGGWDIGTEAEMRSQFYGQLCVGELIKSSTHTDYMLSVDGKIAARECIIIDGTGEWADFVFDDNYGLMPLADVENAIREKKHLPGIPSAADVKENGVNIGQMQVKLLQKVEELTLYVIEQEKKIQSLQEKLAEQK